MARQLTIITPENIPVTIELAGIGTRFGALMIDILVMFGVYLAGVFIGGLVAALTSWSGASGVVAPLMIVGAFVVLFGYSIFFETFWNGQTPGKKFFGLRVMRDGGFPVDFYSVATRNLMRLADFLPISYAAGALSVFFHPEYKRLGDMVGGTVVVREREVGSVGLFPVMRAKSAAGAGEAPRLPEGVVDPIEVLTRDEIEVLRRFSLRRWEMTPDDAERLAYRLIVPMVGRLNIRFIPGVAPRYADLVTVLVSDIDARLSEVEYF
ncbi:MAG TPA: RDD family protein [Armatimonadaceae bacterium]|nr:RDD family protein [Armatimonadaceae bacterium]